MTVMRILRVLSVMLATAGLIDPAIRLQRHVPAPVRLVADADDPDASAVAGRLRAALGGTVDFRLDKADGAIPTVLIGDARDDAIGDGDGPLSVVSLEESPSLAIVDAPGTISLMPGSATRIPVTLHGVGLAGRTTAVVLEQDGVELARVDHAWKGEGSANVHLPYIAPVAGARRLTVRVEPAAAERRLRDNQADILAMTTDRPARVAVVETRPSWLAGLTRRALETNPDIRVSSLLRTSRGIESRAGDPPAFIQAQQLWPFDVVLVGGPEELQKNEVEALWQFAGRRGGTVILLPDKAPSGPYAQRLPGKSSEHLLNEPRILDPAGVLASEVLSMHPLPRGGRALAMLGPAPVIVSWPVGDGRIVFSGALDAWRYRGDPKSRVGQFWRDELLSAALSAPPAVRIVVEPAVVRPGGSVRVKVRLRQTEWADGRGAEIALPAVEARVSDSSGTLETIRLWPDVEPGSFRGELVPAAPGIHTIRAETAQHAAAETTVLVDATAAPAPSRPAALEDVATVSGGVSVAASQLDPLVQHLSSVSRSSAAIAVHPFRSAWWTWVFSALLCGEWALRRRMGLR